MDESDGSWEFSDISNNVLTISGGFTKQTNGGEEAGCAYVNSSTDEKRRVISCARHQRRQSPCLWTCGAVNVVSDFKSDLVMRYKTF